MTAVWGLLASLLWGTADFLAGTISRRLPVLTVTFLSQLVGFGGAVVAALVAGGPYTIGSYLAWGAAAGVIGPLALMAFYRALATGTMGVVAPIAVTGVAVPVLVGLAAGERPSALQLLGIATAIVGVMLASGPELRAGVPGHARAVALAVFAAAGFGTVFVLLAGGSQTSVTMTLVVQRAVNIVTLGTALLAVMLMRAAAGNRARAAVRLADVPVLVGIGLGDVGANGLFGLAASTDLLTITAVLSSLYPVVTALLARYVHAERLRRVQVVGTAAAVGGALLIAGG
jgi:drug/metabolite transporter (DMT)-like permease